MTSTIKRPTGKFIQSGSLTISNVGTSDKTVTVTFDTPFSNVPDVVISLRQSYNRRIGADNITATGFTASGALLTGSSTATIWADWIAVGN